MSIFVHGHLYRGRLYLVGLMYFALAALDGLLGERVEWGEEGRTMTRMIADAALKARLEGLKEVVEVCDEAGRVLGFLHPAPAAKSIESPFSDEEIRERLKDLKGRTLGEFMRELEAR